MVGISVIICCFNSSKRIKATLKHIAEQITLENLNWEVIIVENNCSDNTVEVVKSEWQKYSKCKAELRIVSQPKPGLSFAREKGIDASIFDLVLFCDDDNWLNSDYLQKAFEIFESNPNIDILGGIGYPEYEIDPPTWFNTLNINHATGKQADKQGDITKEKGAVYGAGMLMKKKIFKEMKDRGFESILSDRKGKSLSSGGDTEYCFAARLLGKKIYYSEELQFKHFLTKSRMTWDYNIRIFYAGGFSYSKLLVYKYFYEQENPTWLKWKIFLLKSILNHSKKQFSSFKRLYFFWFKKTEGEEYILNYSFRSGFLNGMLLNLIKSKYFTVKTLILNFKSRNEPYK